MAAGNDGGVLGALFRRIFDLLGLVWNIAACLTIVRLPCMVRHFMEMDSLHKWRTQGLSQLFIFVLDIPYMAMLVCLLPFTLWIPLIKAIKRKNIKIDYTYKNPQGIYYGGNELRVLIFSHFFRLITCFISLPFGLVVLLSWRSHKLINIFKTIEWSIWNENNNWCANIVGEFFQLIMDIVCIIFGIVLLPTWQSYRLIQEMKKMKSNNKKWDEIRFLTIKHIFTFLVELPFYICGLVVIVTLWRLPKLIISLKETKGVPKKICEVFFAHFLMLYFDIISFPPFLFIMVTGWRVYPLLRDIGVKCCKNQITSSDEEHDQNVQEDYVKKIYNLKMHSVIAMHFIRMVLDIPALVISLLMFLSIFSFPGLIAKLKQSSDFYDEFSLIVFKHMTYLIRAFVYLFLFAIGMPWCVLLMILCPVQFWVLLLEDSNHRKSRLLKYYKQWIPDIIKKRDNVYQSMDEEFSSCIVNGSSAKKVNKHLKKIMHCYLGKLLWIAKKVKKYDLNPNFKHSLSRVCWWESNRARKMTRLYMCERNFIVHPNVNLHRKNHTRHNNEMVKFEAKVSEAYRQLRDFQVRDVPLWSDCSGLSERPEAETLKLLIKCFPLERFILCFLTLLNLIPLYRFPALIARLCLRWYDRKRIILNSCKNYLKDLLTALGVLLILLFVYRAPLFLGDVIYDIFYIRSWKAVRKTVNNHVKQMLKDSFNLIFLPHLIFTSVFIGVQVPGNIFFDVSKLVTSKKALACFIPISLHFIIIFFVFFIMGSFNSQAHTVICGFLVGFLVCLFIMLLVLVKKSGEGKLHVKPLPYDYVRLNFTNMHAVGKVLLEFFQLVALIFSIEEFPIMGSSILNTTSKNFLFLNFVSFEFKFWAILALFIICFLTIVSPAAFELHEPLKNIKCANSSIWYSVLSLFTNTLFIIIMVSMCSVFVCDYQDGCSEIFEIVNNTNISGVHDNQTICLSLIDDPSVACWVGNHRTIAIITMICLVWYLTTSLLTWVRYGDSHHPNLDLQFSPLYDTLINFTKAFMVVTVIFGYSKPLVALAVLVFLNFTAFIITVSFKNVSNISTSNSNGMVIWRTASFLGATVIASTAIVVVHLDNPSSYTPVWVVVGSLAFIIVVAILLTLMLRQALTNIEKKRKTFRQEILMLEKKLRNGKMMVESWKKQRKKWRRLAKSLVQANKGEANCELTDWNAIQAVEQTATSDASPPLLDGPPPPPYQPPAPLDGPTPLLSPPVQSDDNTINIEVLPPPPDYISAVQDAPPSYTELYESNQEQPEQTTTASSPFFQHNDDEYILHTTTLRTFAQAIDGIQVCDKDDYSKARFIDTVDINGQTVLLNLFDNINYTAFSYSFIPKLSLWKKCVRKSNWYGLDHCLSVLKTSLTNSFNSPSNADIAISNGRFLAYELPPDTQIEEPGVE